MATQKKSKATSKKSPETKEIVRELKKVGRNLKVNFDLALESEEKEKVEREVKKGIDCFVQEIDKVASEIKRGALDDKVRTGIFKGLRKTNEALEKVSRNWTPVDKKT